MSGLKWESTQYKNYKTITSLLPKKVKTCYIPFCGPLDITKYVLEYCEPEEIQVSDTHKELINFYFTITYKFEDFLRGLNVVLSRFDRLQYYKLRRRYDETEHIIERAIAFYILVKTCKGIFPRDGKLMAPKADTIVDWNKEKTNLEELSKWLKNKKLLMYQKNYIDLIEPDKTTKEDFVYFDLPKSFSQQQIMDLDEFVSELQCDWLITTNHPDVCDVMSDYYNKNHNNTYYITNNTSYLP